MAPVGGIALGQSKRFCRYWIGNEHRDVAVDQKIGVVCKSCEEKIPIEDEYVPGLLGAEIAARLYRPAPERVSDFANRAWQKRLSCRNPDCQQTHDYTGGDLVLYNE
jgi:hypothetical protein